jgi:hypothetical protein
MSSISTIPSQPPAYQPTSSAATRTKPPTAQTSTAPAAPPADKDHDGDVDGSGVDVKG